MAAGGGNGRGGRCVTAGAGEGGRGRGWSINRAVCLS